MPLGERFLFDESFDEKDIARAEAEAEAKKLAEKNELMEFEPIAPSFTEEDIDIAREEGFKSGHEAGLKEAADTIEAKIGDTLGIINDNLGDLFNRQALDAANTFTDSVNIAVTIAKKCFPYINEINGFIEIERMVQEVLTEVLEEPRVIVYINPSIKDLFDSRMKIITRNSNFTGQVIILEEDEISPGNCRITWSNGSAERDLAGTIGRIEQIVEANLDGLTKPIEKASEKNYKAAEEIEDNATDIPAQANNISGAELVAKDFAQNNKSSTKSPDRPSLPISAPNSSDASGEDISIGIETDRLTSEIIGNEELNNSSEHNFSPSAREHELDPGSGTETNGAEPKAGHAAATETTEPIEVLEIEQNDPTSAPEIAANGESIVLDEHDNKTPPIDSKT